MEEASFSVESFNQQDEKIRVGISMCLLGEKVRYDGGHKKNRYIHQSLGPYFDWVPVCPEFEVGMGVPRETVRLVGNKEKPEMLGTKTQKDWTAPMLDFSESRVEKLKEEKLCGFIFKKDSPSCGVERVKVYGKENEVSITMGQGIFAKAFIERFPFLPVEEEGRLYNLKLRENFIERVFAFSRLQKFISQPFSSQLLVEFHASHKYLLLAHSPKHYKLMGKFVGEMREFSNKTEFLELYCQHFMEALQTKTSVKKHLNVLHHILGFLKQKLDPKEKKGILEVIEDYQQEIIPLVVPLTLLKHYVQKYQIDYILNQFYLNPHPKELMLRNHV